MNQAYAQRLANIRAAARCGAKTRAGSPATAPRLRGGCGAGYTAVAARARPLALQMVGSRTVSGPARQ